VLTLDIRTPRSGRVDPETCPVCAGLRAELTASITTASRRMATATVRAMHVHMIYGHPNDPCTIRPRESTK